MNEQKPPVISHNLTEEKNNDELIIIKEDYQSSPKCGIKCKIVKKVIKNIIFTPVEISAQPYFKYSVTQIKEEQKNDISQSETDNTKLLEDKSKTYNLSTNSNNDDLKSSQQDTKIEKSEKIEQTGDVSYIGNNKEEKEKENDYNYIHIIEKKESEKTLNLSYKFKDPEDKENKVGNKAKKYLHKGSSKINVKLNLNNIEKEKEKDKDKEKEKEKEKEKGKRKRKFRNSQNIYKYLNNIAISYNIHSEKENNGSFLKISLTKENKEKDNKKNAAILNFNSTNLKKDKNYSPKNIAKDKKDIMKLASSFTSTNIKRYKKPKKNQENDSKKKIFIRQRSYIPAPKGKKNKIVLNNEKEKEKDKDKKTRRRTLIPKEEIKKENKKIYNNILNKDKDINKIKIIKLRNKNIKMKSLGDNNCNKDETLNLDPYNKKTEKDKCWTPKRKINYNLKKEDTIKEMEDNTSSKYCCSNSNSLKNSNLLKTLKGKRRVSFFNNILIF